MNKTCVQKCSVMYASGEKITFSNVKTHCFELMCCTFTSMCSSHHLTTLMEHMLKQKFLVAIICMLRQATFAFIGCHGYRDLINYSFNRRMEWFVPYCKVFLLHTQVVPYKRENVLKWRKKCYLSRSVQVHKIAKK